MELEFDGTEGEMITITNAQTAMQNYLLSSTFISNNGIRGFLFGKNKIETILEQDECLGVRIYYGFFREVNNSLSPQLIIVGTDKNGNDVLDSELVLDAGLPCPRSCPPNISLYE